MKSDQSYTINKIVKVLKHLPSKRRGFEPYKVYVDDFGRVYRYAPSFETLGFQKEKTVVYTGKYVNCFEHAFFNLTNEQILVADFDSFDAKNFAAYYTFLKQSPEEHTIRYMRNFAEKVGFKTTRISRDDKVLKSSKKVAIYFSDWIEDFHVYLEESNTKNEHIWSAKKGFSEHLEKVDRLQDQMGDYQYYATLEISPRHPVKEKVRFQDEKLSDERTL